MTGQRGASSVTSRCFIPLSVHLTPICTAEHRFSRSQSCCFYQLFIAVDMQCREDTYFAYTPNQLVLDTPKISFSSCYNKLSVGYFGLKRHRHILRHPRPILHLIKRSIIRCPLKECRKGKNDIPAFERTPWIVSRSGLI